MIFEEAKKRKDYKFTTTEIESLIDDIRNNCMKDLYANGDGYRGVAVLEIGHVDVEVNIYSYGQCVLGADPEDQTPLIDYFTCLKHGETNDSWRSDDYLDYSLNVDWKAANWKEQLEKDMFKALDGYVKANNYSYDHAN